jgi:hypothetical protein
VGILRTIFIPSWSATFGKEYKAPWHEAKHTYQQVNQNTLSGIKHAEYASYILKSGLKEDGQKRIIRRHLKLGKFYYYCLLVSITLSVLLLGCWWQSILNTYVYSVIMASCSIQFFKLWIINLHRAKQVIVGAFFPCRWMIMHWKNVSRFDDGIYYKGKLVHKSLPLWGENLSLLLRLEQQSLLKEGHHE